MFLEFWPVGSAQYRIPGQSITVRRSTGLSPDSSFFVGVLPDEIEDISELSGFQTQLGTTPKDWALVKLKSNEGDEAFQSFLVESLELLGPTGTTGRRIGVSLVDFRALLNYGVLPQWAFNLDGRRDTFIALAQVPGETRPPVAEQWTLRQIVEFVVKAAQPNQQTVMGARIHIREWNSILPSYEFLPWSSPMDALRQILDDYPAVVSLHHDGLHFEKPGQDAAPENKKLFEHNLGFLDIAMVDIASSGRKEGQRENLERASGVMVVGGDRIASVAIDDWEPVLRFDTQYVPLDIGLAILLNISGADSRLNDILQQLDKARAESDTKKILELGEELGSILPLRIAEGKKAPDDEIEWLRELVLRPETLKGRVVQPGGVGLTEEGLKILRRDAYKLYRMPQADAAYKNFLPMVARGETLNDVRLPISFEAYTHRRQSRYLVDFRDGPTIAGAIEEADIASRDLAIIAKKIDDLVGADEPLIDDALDGPDLEEVIGGAAGAGIGGLLAGPAGAGVGLVIGGALGESFLGSGFLGAEGVSRSNEERLDDRTNRAQSQLSDVQFPDLSGARDHLRYSETINQGLSVFAGGLFTPDEIPALQAEYRAKLKIFHELSLKAEPAYTGDLEVELLRALEAVGKGLELGTSDGQAGEKKVRLILEQIEGRKRRGGSINSSEQRRALEFKQKVGSRTLMFNELRRAVPGTVEDGNLGIVRFNNLPGWVYDPYDKDEKEAALRVLAGGGPGAGKRVDVTAPTVDGLRFIPMPVRVTFGTALKPFRSKPDKAETRGVRQPLAYFQGDNLFPPQVAKLFDLEDSFYRFVGTFATFHWRGDTSYKFKQITSAEDAKVIYEQPDTVTHNTNRVKSVRRPKLKELITLEGGSNADSLLIQANDIAAHILDNDAFDTSSHKVAVLDARNYRPSGKIAGVEITSRPSGVGYITTVKFGRTLAPFTTANKPILPAPKHRSPESLQARDPEDAE
jgi:hypothetical protein